MRFKKYILIILGLILLGGLGWGFNFYWKNLRGIKPAILPGAQNIVEIANKTGLPLKIPAGFSMSIFAKDLPGARVMIKDFFNNLWVSQTSEGTVSLLEINKDTGELANQGVVFKDLNHPHGLAFDPINKFALFIAEEDKIIKVPTYSEYDVQKIIDLPGGGNHFTRTLGFGPDNRLYISIGSSCNVCNETDNRRAAIFSMNQDGSDFKQFAKGLRNTVFFTWHPNTKEMWGTNMGRDLLGDNLPPDTINIIKQDNNYGWPICYGKNIHDTDFDKNTYIRNPCMEPFETPSHIDIQAHSAPLGLAFFPANSDWPKEYWNNLLVAYHGSWNRSVPTGYKIVRIKLDDKGNVLGEPEDFITGWLANGEALGRPVGIIIQPNGIIYISDDKAGVIYKVSLNKN